MPPKARARKAPAKKAMKPAEFHQKVRNTAAARLQGGIKAQGVQNAMLNAALRLGGGALGGYVPPVMLARQVEAQRDRYMDIARGVRDAFDNININVNIGGMPQVQGAVPPVPPMAQPAPPPPPPPQPAQSASSGASSGSYVPPPASSGSSGRSSGGPAPPPGPGIPVGNAPAPGPAPMPNAGPGVPVGAARDGAPNADQLRAEMRRGFARLGRQNAQVPQPAPPVAPAPAPAAIPQVNVNLPDDVLEFIRRPAVNIGPLQNEIQGLRGAVQGLARQPRQVNVDVPQALQGNIAGIAAGVQGLGARLDGLQNAAVRLHNQNVEAANARPGVEAIRDAVVEGVGREVNNQLAVAQRNVGNELLAIRGGMDEADRRNEVRAEELDRRANNRDVLLRFGIEDGVNYLNRQREAGVNYLNRERQAGENQLLEGQAENYDAVRQVAEAGRVAQGAQLLMHNIAQAAPAPLQIQAAPPAAPAPPAPLVAPPAAPAPPRETASQAAARNTMVPDPITGVSRNALQMAEGQPDTSDERPAQRVRTIGQVQQAVQNLNAAAGSPGVGPSNAAATGVAPPSDGDPQPPPLARLSTAATRGRGRGRGSREVRNLATTMTYPTSSGAGRGRLTYARGRGGRPVQGSERNGVFHPTPS